MDWSKVDKSGECWLWTGQRATVGYGQIGHNSLAHRIAWEGANGPIPSGMGVLHRCDTPLCVNPDHLFLGTFRDNMADKIAKGRQARGAQLPQTKLSAENVSDIRSRAGEPQLGLAREFGVTQSHISRIIAGKAWSYLYRKEACA